MTNVGQGQRGKKLQKGKSKLIEKVDSTGTISSISETGARSIDDKEPGACDVELDSESETLLVFNRLSIRVTASPVIGVLMNITYDNGENGKFYIRSALFYNLRQYGARVKPVWLGQEVEYYYEIFRFTNGLYIPNYPINMEQKDAESVTTAVDIFCRFVILEQSTKGTYWPIWAVGSGMNILMCSAGAKTCLTEVTEDYTGSIRLKRTMEVEDSTFCSHAHPSALHNATASTIAPVNYRSLILLDESVAQYLKDQFNVIFVCKSLAQKNIYCLAMVEAKRYPFYGTIVEPELLHVDWVKETIFERNVHAVRFASYHFAFFVNEASRNAHSPIEDPSFNDRQLLDHYSPLPSPVSQETTDLWYVFPEKPMDGVAAPAVLKNNAVTVMDL